MSNLPPGMNVNDIPGNRPEDELEDLFWEELNKRFQQEYHHHVNTIVNLMDIAVLEDALVCYVRLARDIGYQRGYNEGVDEKRMYDHDERE